MTEDKGLEQSAESHEAPSEEQLAAELDAVMTSLLDPILPNPALLSRLQSSIAQPPQRYAPFYDRLAKLFDLSEDAVITQLTRLGQPDAWRRTGLPGVRN